MLGLAFQTPTRDPKMSPAFRTDESLEAEHRARALIKPFLESKGCSDVMDIRKKIGTATTQTITASLPGSAVVQMRVKFCWRRRGLFALELTYSAAQLIAKVAPGESEMRVRAFSARAAREGTDYFLFVQPDSDEITLAALVPVGALGDIWAAQRNKSAELIAEGRTGRRLKNHAENGHSPTIWLRDEEVPEVPELLWLHDGVIDLEDLPLNASRAGDSVKDDTFQDTLILDYDSIGSDTPTIIVGEMSHVKRNARVRRAVLVRANGSCERPGCNAALPFLGFLDVHHILGVGTSDRVWNCVALCPNCHREAHVSPKSKEFNKILLEIANRSRTKRVESTLA